MPARWPAMKPESESDILAAIRKLDPLNTCLLRNSRGKFRVHGNWYMFGCGPNGTSDVLGWRTIRIRPEMVGKRIAQFLALETKRAKEDARENQQAFIDSVNASGGIAGVAYSAEDAVRLLGLMEAAA